MAKSGKKKQLTDVPPRAKKIKKRRYADLTVDEAERSEFVAALQRTGCDQDPVCVLRKWVSNSDTSNHHCRFLLPHEALLGAKQSEGKHLNLIMSESERTTAREAENGLDVKVLGRSGNVRNMAIRYLSSNKAYRMIRGDIMVFVHENRMREGQVFELWAYREGGKLKLGVLNYDAPQPAGPAPSAPTIADRQESSTGVQEANVGDDVAALVAGPVPPVPATDHQVPSAGAHEANVVNVPVLIAREPEAAQSHRRPYRPKLVPLDQHAEDAMLLMLVNLAHKSN